MKYSNILASVSNPVVQPVIFEVPAISRKIGGHQTLSSHEKSLAIALNACINSDS